MGKKGQYTPSMSFNIQRVMGSRENLDRRKMHASSEGKFAYKITMAGEGRPPSPAPHERGKSTHSPADGPPARTAGAGVDWMAG